MADLIFSSLNVHEQSAIRDASRWDGISDGTHFALVDRLTEAGWLEKYAENPAQDGGVTRHYRLTAAGRDAYGAWLVAVPETAHTPASATEPETDIPTGQAWRELTGESTAGYVVTQPAAPALSPNNPTRHIPSDRDRAYSAYREATAKAGGKVLSFVGWLRLSEVAQPDAPEQAGDDYGDGYEAGMTDYARLYAQLLEARAELKLANDYIQDRIREADRAEKAERERDELLALLATIRRYTGDHDMTDLTTEQVLGMAVGTLKIRDIADKALAAIAGKAVGDGR